MAHSPSVSVIIVSYNTGAILLRCIESVLKQDGLEEIILVNNGNPEDMLHRLEALEKQHKKVRLLSGHGNIGFAAACNLGAKDAKGDLLLLLNPDCIVPRNALKQTAEALSAHPDAWLAGCCLITPNRECDGGSKRNILTPKIALFQTLQFYRISRSAFPSLNIPDDESDTNASYVPAISGAYMMLPKEKYTALGGLDEGYFFHVEDLDLCFQVKQKGGKILYVPSVKTIHYRSTSNVSSLFIEKHKTKGFLRYFKKNFKEKKKGVFSLVLYLLVALGVSVRFLLRLFPMLLAAGGRAKKQAARDGLHRRQKELLSVPLPLSDAEKKRDFSSFSPVLLTGATGQVGIAVLRQLLTRNISTIALYHQHVIDFDAPNLIWHQGNLGSALDLGEHSPKTVIHTPPIWLLPEHLEALAAKGVKRVIAFSSTSIESKSKSSNLYEQELVQKFLHAEEAIAEKCADLNMEWTIFRPTMIYGLGLDRNISSIVRVIRKYGFFPVHPPGKGLRMPVHADDLADATFKALDNPAACNKYYTLAGATKIAYLDMVRKIFFVMGKKDKARFLPLLPLFLDIFSLISGKEEINGEIARRMNRDLVFDDTDARKEFGYNPRSFLSGGLRDLALKKGEFEVKR